MKRYVEYLSRELFRYALTVTILLFLLFTIGLIANLQHSTVGVLDDGASRLARYWGESVAQIEAGVGRLAEEHAVSSGLLSNGSPDEQAAMYRMLYDEVNTWAPGSSFMVTNAAGDVVASNLYDVNLDLIADPGMVNSLRASVAKSTDGFAYQALWTRLVAPHAGAYVTATRVTDASGAWDGSLLIGILGESGLIEQVHAQSIERIVVADAFDNTLLDTAARQGYGTSELSGKFAHEVSGLLTLTANGVDYFYASQVDPITGATITVLTPQRFFWRFVSTSFVILGVVAVVTVVLARVLTRRRSRRSAKALERLDQGITEWFRGNLDFRLAEPAYGEFSGIYESFNDLVGKLDSQVKSNAALERSHTALEVRQLETQFNPHFVFNTMEMLRYEINSDPAVASQIVLDLAGLMRYSIRERGNAVRLSEDVAYLRSYLDLHKLRLGERLHYRFDCTPESLDALIPRLLIQPLVENALAHAHPPDGENLHVRVSATVDDDVLVICVDDNGRGMDPGLLEEIQESLASDEQPRAHLGIFLVHRVVSLIYGRDGGYGLKLTSDRRGTRARVRLPYEV